MRLYTLHEGELGEPRFDPANIGLVNVTIYDDANAFIVKSYGNRQIAPSICVASDFARPMLLRGQQCTEESKMAFLTELANWLQTRPKFAFAESELDEVCDRLRVECLEPIA